MFEYSIVVVILITQHRMTRKKIRSINKITKKNKRDLTLQYLHIILYLYNYSNIIKMYLLMLYRKDKT